MGTVGPGVIPKKARGKADFSLRLPPLQEPLSTRYPSPADSPILMSTGTVDFPFVLQSLLFMSLLVQAWTLASELISLPYVYYLSICVPIKCYFRVKSQV